MHLKLLLKVFKNHKISMLVLMHQMNLFFETNR